MGKRYTTVIFDPGTGAMSAVTSQYPGKPAFASAATIAAL
jgi:hypothetical protein